MNTSVPGVICNRRGRFQCTITILLINAVYIALNHAHENHLILILMDFPEIIHPRPLPLKAVQPGNHRIYNEMKGRGIMKFLETPNLPESDVGLVAVSAAVPSILARFKEMGIRTLPVLPQAALHFSIQSHADLLCHPLGENRIAVARGETSFRRALESYHFEVQESASEIRSPYPQDTALNAARIGNFLIANPKILDRVIQNYCIENDIRILPVRQGYAKCSVAVVDRNSLMTADRGIAEVAEKAGFEVLKLREGHIRLRGYSYGFIGGACGLIGRKLLAFAGNPEFHPDFAEMKKFLNQRQIKIKPLMDGPLCDIGGILPLLVHDDG